MDDWYDKEKKDGSTTLVVPLPASACRCYLIAASARSALKNKNITITVAFLRPPVPAVARRGCNPSCAPATGETLWTCIVPPDLWTEPVWE